MTNYSLSRELRNGRGLPPLEAIHAEMVRRQTEAARKEVAKAGAISLANFVKMAWSILEPMNPLIWGWAMEAICEHLEAITDGRIKRLLVNVPPGFSKSLLTCVFWPAWEWGPKGRADLRYVCTTYNKDFTRRDSIKMRSLVQSEWYQSHWPHVKLTRVGDLEYYTTVMGHRWARPFESLTGARGDRLIIDDPHSVTTAESELERARTIRIFREAAQTRFNTKDSAIAMIMQRLHDQDCSGQAIALKLGYEHLNLPMEFEVANRCRTSIGFADPRVYEGQLLFPERFPPTGDSPLAVDRLKKSMGPYAIAGQFQQRPVPREGGLFKTEWFNKRVNFAPVRCKFVRHWDLAASLRKTGYSHQAWTAGVKMGFDPVEKIYYVAHVARFQLEGMQVRAAIKNYAEMDGRSCIISLPQDPGQSGKTQKQDMVGALAGWNVFCLPESIEGDKYARAEPFSSQCAAGNVVLVEGPWNQTYIDEMTAFPNSAAKDQVDASSGAFARLLKTEVIRAPAGLFVHRTPRQFPGMY